MSVDGTAELIRDVGEGLRAILIDTTGQYATADGTELMAGFSEELVELLSQAPVALLFAWAQRIRAA